MVQLITPAKLSLLSLGMLTFAVSGKTWHYLGPILFGTVPGPRAHACSTLTPTCSPPSPSSICLNLTSSTRFILSPFPIWPTAHSPYTFIFFRNKFHLLAEPDTYWFRVYLLALKCKTKEKRDFVLFSSLMYSQHLEHA